MFQTVPINELRYHEQNVIDQSIVESIKIHQDLLEEPADPTDGPGTYPVFDVVSLVMLEADLVFMPLDQFLINYEHDLDDKFQVAFL